MDKKLSEKEKTLGFIDAMVTLCNNLPKLDGTSSMLQFNGSPLEFLIDITRHVGCFDKLTDWLTEFLTGALPGIELAVKGILLANFKKMFFCSADPRIPNNFRLSLSALGQEDYINETRGIFVDLSAIDFNGMLTISPFSDVGKTYYFGVKNYMNPYSFVRAEDMNAFLWLVTNKSVFPSPQTINSVSDIHPNATGTLLDKIILNNIPENESIALGSSYKYNNGNIIHIVCDEKIINQQTSNLTNNPINNRLESQITRNYDYLILPYSYNNMSCNWHVNRDKYFDFLSPYDEHKARDYTKDIGLFNLKYIDGTSVNYGKLKLTILPKPFVHLPCKNEPAYRIQRILFDYNGTPNQNGNYTVSTDSTRRTVTDEKIIYNVNGNNTLEIDTKTGRYYLTDTSEEALAATLYECYKGLTVYEFNYDFVMGMQLFDAKLIASQIIDATVNLRLGFGLPKIKHTVTQGQARIAEIVRKIIETDGTEVSDCSFSFSNDEELQMMEKSEDLKASGYNFKGYNNIMSEINAEDIINIIDGISDEATLEENVETIKHAFEQITANITDEIPPEDKFGFEFNFIASLIANLVNTLVNALITPKIVLLFIVNKQIMGDFSFYFNIEEFIQAIWNIIVSIIKEVVDLILKELLEWILKYLGDLIACATSLVIKEQIEQYRRLIRLILDTCKFNLDSLLYESKLDTVYGADIVDNTEDQPQTDECS